MRGRVGTCLATVVLCALGGCGTSLNLDGDSRVYGGVAQDLQEARERMAAATSPTWPGTPGAYPGWNAAVGALALADLPLSLIGDTLTLPFTIPTALEEKRDHSSAAAPADGGGAKTEGNASGQSRPANVSMGW